MDDWKIIVPFSAEIRNFIFSKYPSWLRSTPCPLYTEEGAFFPDK
jgi:hypothetical protein